MKNDIGIQGENITLKINEIFFSIQGESTHVGRPCVFVRLTYCNLRCTYCDTTYAFFEGQEMALSEIIDQIGQYECNLVEITGGEPLIQKNVHLLMAKLCDQGYEVLLETAGHMDITVVDPRVSRIMDIKCPSSGESEKFMWSNIDALQGKDEIKFVAGSMEDLIWIKSLLEKHEPHNKCSVIVSPVFGKMNNRILAEWILENHLPVRMQIQLHKQIWEATARGR
jgi:7-carboxy-7-deazaguanine synthase